jgi:hypothetical protein
MHADSPAFEAWRPRHTTLRQTPALESDVPVLEKVPEMIGLIWICLPDSFARNRLNVVANLSLPNGLTELFLVPEEAVISGDTMEMFVPPPEGQKISPRLY